MMADWVNLILAGGLAAVFCMASGTLIFIVGMRVGMRYPKHPSLSDFKKFIEDGDFFEGTELDPPKEKEKPLGMDGMEE